MDDDMCARLRLLHENEVARKQDSDMRAVTKLIKDQQKRGVPFTAPELELLASITALLREERGHVTGCAAKMTAVEMTQ